MNSKRTWLMVQRLLAFMTRRLDHLDLDRLTTLHMPTGWSTRIPGRSEPLESRVWALLILCWHNSVWLQLEAGLNDVLPHWRKTIRALFINNSRTTETSLDLRAAVDLAHALQPYRPYVKRLAFWYCGDDRTQIGSFEDLLFLSGAASKNTNTVSASNATLSQLLRLIHLEKSPHIETKTFRGLGLSPNAKRLWSWLILHGSPIDMGVLTALSGESEAEVLSTVHSLSRFFLIHTQNTRNGFVFRFNSNQSVPEDLGAEESAMFSQLFGLYCTPDIVRLMSADVVLGRRLRFAASSRSAENILRAAEQCVEHFIVSGHPRVATDFAAWSILEINKLTTQYRANNLFNLLVKCALNCGLTDTLKIAQDTLLLCGFNNHDNPTHLNLLEAMFKLRTSTYAEAYSALSAEPVHESEELESWRLWIDYTCAMHGIGPSPISRMEYAMSWCLHSDRCAETRARALRLTAQLHYREGRFSDSFAVASEAAEVSSEVVRKASSALAAAASAMEIGMLSIGRRLAERGHHLAMVAMHQYEITRASRILIELEYREGRFRSPDMDTLRSLRTLDHGSFDIGLFLVYAACGWRLGQNGIVIELADFCIEWYDRHHHIHSNIVARGLRAAARGYICDDDIQTIRSTTLPDVGLTSNLLLAQGLALMVRTQDLPELREALLKVCRVIPTAMFNTPRTIFSIAEAADVFSEDELLLLNRP